MGSCCAKTLLAIRLWILLVRLFTCLRVFLFLRILVHMLVLLKWVRSNFATTCSFFQPIWAKSCRKPAPDGGDDGGGGVEFVQIHFLQLLDNIESSACSQ